MENMENTVVDEVVKTNKVDWKGVGVIGAVTAAAVATTVFVVKKIKAAKAKKAEVKPEEAITEAEA